MTCCFAPVVTDQVVELFLLMDLNWKTSSALCIGCTQGLVLLKCVDRSSGECAQCFDKIHSTNITSVEENFKLFVGYYHFNSIFYKCRLYETRPVVEERKNKLDQKHPPGFLLTFLSLLTLQVLHLFLRSCWCWGMNATRWQETCLTTTAAYFPTGDKVKTI